MGCWVLNLGQPCKHVKDKHLTFFSIALAEQRIPELSNTMNLGAKSQIVPPLLTHMLLY